VKLFLRRPLAKSTLRKRLEDFEATNRHAVFEKVIAGYSLQELRSKAQSTNYYDVRNPAFGNLTQHQVVSNNNKTTLNNSLPYGVSATVIRGATGSAVLLPSDWAGQSDTADILLHEVLHLLFPPPKSSDEEVMKAFGIQKTGQGSHDITDWLGRDCKGK